MSPETSHVNLIETFLTAGSGVTLHAILLDSESLGTIVLWGRLANGKAFAPALHLVRFGPRPLTVDVQPTEFRLNWPPGKPGN
ncbi:hypothetical protein PCASD_20630 [Puccinia coronata f. sp. avenae]|uniref:Uncharacterized protein n=1 Tax=Puccinia coronata f. sp. avenae TaxID=200324 RepID=A0A2N5U1A3_9BASI|nr:hypothetical protein PCASD_20630 [Puccinia coronata f. sp. avenae]